MSSKLGEFIDHEINHLKMALDKVSLKLDALKAAGELKGLGHTVQSALETSVNGLKSALSNVQSAVGSSKSTDQNQSNT